MEKFGFPGTIVCIDGTHVAIVQPKEHVKTFHHRKFYHSLNVMIVSILYKSIVDRTLEVLILLYEYCLSILY